MALPLVGGLLITEAAFAAAEAVLVAAGIVSGVAVAEKLGEVERKKKDISNQVPHSTQVCAQAANNAKALGNVSDEELENDKKEAKGKIEEILGHNDLTSDDRRIIAEKEEEIKLIDKEIEKRKNKIRSGTNTQDKKVSSRSEAGQKQKTAEAEPKQAEIGKHGTNNKPNEVESDLTKTRIRGEENKFHRIKRDSEGKIIDVKSSKTPFKS